MLATGSVLGQEAPASANSPATQGGSDFWDIVLAGGSIGYVIMFLSVAAVALAIEHALSIRAAILVPDGIVDRVRGQLASGQLNQALQQCKLRPSFFSEVVAVGLNEADNDWPVIEKAMEDAAAEQAARLSRKVEYLSVIANLAPMLGLLGTVIGMVVAFRQVAISQGTARAADLAEGIYLALVTTVEGLVVAIPTLALYAFFKNRVDQVVSEAVRAVTHATTPLRRRQRAMSIEPPPIDEVHV